MRSNIRTEYESIKLIKKIFKDKSLKIKRSEKTERADKKNKNK